MTLTSCSSPEETAEKKMAGEIDITWKSDIPGDFSFKDQWSYQEGVYKNSFGQLSCDGFCPEGTEAMKDKNGKIFKDSLSAFYKLVDTTHRYHSLNSETNCYEWAGSNYFKMVKVTKGAFDGYSMSNAGTHCSLKLVIEKNTCLPLISLNSIVANGSDVFNSAGGQIEIDSNLFAKGILKANFDFKFENKGDSAKPLFWKGKIYTFID